MSSLQVRLTDFITAVGTDVKLLRTYITGSSTGDLTTLTTTAKTSLIAAINEVKASATGSPPAATELVQGVAEIATQAETTTGTDDTRFITPLKHRVDSDARYQPLDPDLTSIAAVATTAYGRALLALANQAALTALNALGTTSLPGILQLATQTEVNTGTDNAKAVTPLTFQTRMAAYAVPLTYIDTDVNLTANSDTKVPSQKAAKTYIDGIIAAANAAVYKGVIDASTSPNYPASNAGDMYRISVAGKIGGASGPNVEVGDMLLALTDGTAAGTQAAVGAQWNIIQSNIDGAVVGPASSTSGDLATFSGATGKVVQDSGVAVSTDGTMATNNNTKVPTEAAVRTYLGANYYNQTAIGNPDTDLAAAYTTAKT